MIENALWWLFLNIFFSIILGFYSMQEMACVSFNKFRLHYYVNKGMRRAIWLNELLHHPARLFGTTLLSVNVAMFIGSECARQSYLALGLNPDMAPLTQVAFIVIFAELAPMFAARRFAEQVALQGAPILYFTAKAITPLLWLLGLISRLTDYLMGKKGAEKVVVLNQEDLQKILSLQDEDYNTEEDGDDFDNVSRNIFSLRNKDAKHVMQPISTFPSLPSNATVEQLRQVLKKPNMRSVPLFHRDTTHIVAIAHPNDFVRIPDNRKVREYATAPWFITQNSKVVHILQDFRKNNQSIAIVLDQHGLAIGIIALEDLTEEIFGKLGGTLDTSTQRTPLPLFVINRTFDAEMTIAEFNDQFDVILDEEREITLAQLMLRALGHNPEKGEILYMEPFELTVAETSLTEVKKIHIQTKLK